MKGETHDSYQLFLPGGGRPGGRGSRGSEGTGRGVAQTDGCVAYDVFQSGTRADVLFFCETWRDEAALAEHMKSEPFVKYGSMMKAVGKFTIEQFDLKK